MCAFSKLNGSNKLQNKYVSATISLPQTTIFEQQLLTPDPQLSVTPPQLHLSQLYLSPLNGCPQCIFDVQKEGQSTNYCIGEV